MAKSNTLTATTIQNAKPQEKPVKLSDGGGMYLLINPNGTKYWRMKYRFAGKEKLLALGVYPETSLKEARQRRDDARKLLAMEPPQDPGQVRQTEKRTRKLAATNSFESVAREWYGKQLHTWVKTHSKDVIRRLEVNLFPYIGHRPIAEIDAPELLATVRKIESRGAYDLAHRVMGVSGQIFRYGVATGRCVRDISVDLRGALTPHVKNRQSAVKLEELPELLRSIDGYEAIGDRQTRLGLELLALTFVRTNELIGALWDEFVIDASLWIVPAQRMKMRADHVVPLSGRALAILEELKDLSGGSRFVFPGRNRDKSMSNNTMLFALYRLGYKGKMTGHGFRAVASTAMNESSNFREDVIERQLSHCEPNEVRGAYNRAEYLPERRLLMQWWADYLADIKAGAEVIPFKRVA